LPPAERVEGQKLLREFFEARSELIGQGASGTNPRSADARKKLLYFAVHLLQEHSDAVYARNFDDAVDKYPGVMARVATERRIPPIIWLALYFLTLLSMVPLGYHVGLTGAATTPMTLPLIIAFSMVLVLIADMDSPTRGAIKASSAAIDDVRRLIYSELPGLTNPDQAP
jgi:hypothetical protein